MDFCTRHLHVCLNENLQQTTRPNSIAELNRRLLPFHAVTNLKQLIIHSTMTSDRGDSSQKVKEPVDVERLWHIWNMNGPDLSLSIEICSLLKENKLLYELEGFLRSLPIEEEYLVNETLNRARVKVAFWKEDFESVYSILQNNCFSNAEDLVEVWDLCHYKEEQNRRQKPLTPLIKFRIRQRFMPPVTILPSGERKKTTLPKESTDKLRMWLNANKDHPYPNRDTKLTLAEQTGLSKSQVNTWFANARRRLYRKMREDLYRNEDEKTSKVSMNNVKNKQVKRRGKNKVTSAHSPEIYPDRGSIVTNQSPVISIKWSPSNHPNSQYCCQEYCGIDLHDPRLSVLFHEVNQCMSKPFVYTEDFRMKDEYLPTNIEYPVYGKPVNYPTPYTLPSTHTITSSVGSQCATVESRDKESTNQDAAQILVDLSSKFYK